MQRAVNTPVYSVVIPCYNEGDNIETLIIEVEAALAARAEFEIIVVDDCSTDHTSARLQALRQSREGSLRVLRHRQNSGQSAGLCTGADAARGRWLITLDGDGQNDPADIPHLLAVAEGMPHAVSPLIICGHRTTRRDTWLRRLSSRVANAVRGSILNDGTPATGCGLKVLPSATFRALPRFDHMHRFLPALVRRLGGTAVSVPVNHRPRLHGRSKYGMWNRLGVGVVDLWGVSWLIRRRLNPSGSEEI